MINGGKYLSIDSDGEIDYVVEKRVGVEGSFDSRCEIRSDGSSVEFSGNIARFNRRDNLFGYGWEETIRRINELLNLYSIPPFTSGKLFRFADTGWTWTGAYATRIDITMNYATFAAQNAQAVLRAMAAQHIGRQKGQLSPDGATVMYGYGSKYVSGKLYSKYVEFVNHLRRKSGSHVDESVVDFCQRLGVLREEFTLKSRFLTQNNLRYLGSITQDKLVEVFMTRSQFKRLEKVKYETFDDLPRHLRATYVSWKNGFPIDLSKATFYRHRTALLEYGIDISVPSNVAHFPLRVRTVEVAALEAPNWYRQKFG
ncbi:MAG: DNA replication protein [Oxalobacter sp.]|nr:MAG: DNA replication protein [Oxalobacter sp.]